jgi:hypothetical protein
LHHATTSGGHDATYSKGLPWVLSKLVRPMRSVPADAAHGSTFTFIKAVTFAPFVVKDEASCSKKERDREA